jgi:hypothetical protein
VKQYMPIFSSATSVAPSAHAVFIHLQVSCSAVEQGTIVRQLFVATEQLCRGPGMQQQLLRSAACAHAGQCRAMWV